MHTIEANYHANYLYNFYSKLRTIEKQIKIQQIILSYIIL